MCSSDLHSFPTRRSSDLTLFTDGLHLRDGGWELSIRPDANASALQVEANAPDAAAETAHLLELMERDENQ